jgi:hypothetical protein
MRRHRLVCHGYRAFLSAAEWPSVIVPAEENALVFTVQQQHDDALDIGDVNGKRIVSTRLRHNVSVREKKALATLEVMSRFAANPEWLIVVYSPPPVINIFSRVMIFAPCNFGLSLPPTGCRSKVDAKVRHRAIPSNSLNIQGDQERT